MEVLSKKKIVAARENCRFERHKIQPIAGDGDQYKTNVLVSELIII
jgi:hypothetical protein